MIKVKRVHIGRINDVGGLVGSMAYHFFGGEPAFVKERLDEAAGLAALLIEGLVLHAGLPLPEAIQAISAYCLEPEHPFSSGSATCSATLLPDGTGLLRVSHDRTVLFEIVIAES